VEGRELVDLETVVMLASAITGFLEPLEAVRLILYDLLLVVETLGWTRFGWKVRVKSFLNILLTSRNIDQ